MTRNPFLNAGTAAIYIAALVSSIFYAGDIIEGPDSILVPITMLSLFVLSAAVMGLTFFYQPVRLYLDGETDAAARLLFQTIGIFAGFVALLIGTLFILAIM